MKSIQRLNDLIRKGFGRINSHEHSLREMQLQQLREQQASRAEYVQKTKREFLLWNDLATCMINGGPILTALRLIRDTYSEFESDITNIFDNVKEGENFAPPLEQAVNLHKHMVSYVALGERLGELPEYISRGANLLKPELDVRFDPDAIDCQKMMFYHHLASLTSAGSLLVRSLEDMRGYATYLTQPQFKKLVSMISSGSTFSEALLDKELEGQFTRFDLNIIKWGEIGGCLDRTLCNLANRYDLVYRVTHQDFRGVDAPLLEHRY